MRLTFQKPLKILLTKFYSSHKNYEFQMENSQKNISSSRRPYWPLLAFGRLIFWHKQEHTRRTKKMTSNRFIHNNIIVS